jgi:hypothetical protein
MKKPGHAGLFSSDHQCTGKSCSDFPVKNKNATKRPETKEGGREEEKSRSRIAS